ncbi:branched-chain amino acid ABC transporter permease [Cupriavidus metallidurans]|uniref:branched-chain amino acid ABC transporter permease n=1 Tax=Cupriavidus TaxID=106589 RepID=UPI0002A36DE6|nr:MULTISPECIES: branched-chain amino acid ABC transporter permease [Cupriavidus]ELA01311.1 branched chain amino acid family ABC transporter inner membrane subunit [Cupriavidus sp. HMR-1]GMG92386.1 branched-chain amino acid ABC transporter permease [Cupriavidus sp. TKC]HBO76731.1 branched-chain amino acid ABC transporter permease [Cupriavidus sp.]
MEIFGLPFPVLMGQIVVGLVNGCFYAVLSLGLAVIFGMLNIVNFVHGAIYMLGALLAWLLLDKLGVSYWYSLIIVPLLIGAVGCALERTMLRRLYRIDHVFGILLTLGLAYIIEGLARYWFGAAGMAFSAPPQFAGTFDMGFMRLPKYRVWVIVISLAVCLSTWALIERTRLGSYLRAATENPAIARTFGINVSVLVTLTYGLGVALAGFAGVLAAPIYQVSPIMGSSLIIVVFAVVVIGGMGSILGSILTGLLLGLVEGVTRAYWPEASAVVIFIVMILVLILRPSGLFGKE